MPDPTNQIKPYKHTTFKVKNLSDYLKINFLIEENRNIPYSKEDILCYRGMENLTWKPIPSILVSELFQYESQMINDFITLSPDEFINCRDDLIEDKNYVMYLGKMIGII